MSRERTTSRVRPMSLDSVQAFPSKMCSIFYYLNSCVFTDVPSPFILELTRDNNVFSKVTLFSRFSHEKYDNLKRFFVNLAKSCFMKYERIIKPYLTCPF